MPTRGAPRKHPAHALGGQMQLVEDWEVRSTAMSNDHAGSCDTKWPTMCGVTASGGSSSVASKVTLSVYWLVLGRLAYARCVPVAVNGAAIASCSHGTSAQPGAIWSGV